ncbi:hypothetical protein JAAARDRAFT_48774 [Jaapia argillacea MUCL 33604]|uniref:DDE Tnp4 domain-containing protein n=1 Tax=Jaapia argillacea MUCL 33604 TaxID=933084 RepID=A0A067PVZ8_9AGAM|nr:hypothetical protein JAAARDRAFT_48774 [Jaapia argillacea MUCL 33604]
MEIPETIHTKQDDVVSSIEAMIILCSRLSYPNRLCDLEDHFICQTAQLSCIINFMLEFIYDRWHHLLEFSTERFPPTILEQYAHTILTANCPFDDLAGFLDVKIHNITQPGDYQRVNYNSYLKTHAYKYQAVSAPNGIIILCSGPVEGRRADGAVLAWLGLLEEWAQHARGYGKQLLLLYGDLAYGETDVVVSGLKKVENLTREEQNFNNVMSKYQESVEWSLGKVCNLWASLNYKLQMKSHLSLIGKHFLVSVLLTNAHTYLHGSQIAHYFQLKPPTLTEYFMCSDMCDV